MNTLLLQKLHYAFIIFISCAFLGGCGKSPSTGNIQIRANITRKLRDQRLDFRLGDAFHVEFFITNSSAGPITYDSLKIAFTGATGQGAEQTMEILSDDGATPKSATLNPGEERRYEASSDPNTDRILAAGQPINFVVGGVRGGQPAFVFFTPLPELSQLPQLELIRVDEKSGKQPKAKPISALLVDITEQNKNLPVK